MKQKAVWITGGSRGIGAACVRLFYARGWRVAFTYQHSDEEAKALADACPGVCICRGDMTDAAQVHACHESIKEALGEISALVCNAGRAQQSMFCDSTDEKMEQMFAANYKSAVYAIRQVYDAFVHQKSGAIVTVSSIWGMAGASCESQYAASKAALIALSKSLAQELGPSGIRVNCVAPGVIDTDMNRGHTQETLRALAQETPLMRMGTPQEVAESIFFLASERASFITGQVLGVSGGFII